MIHNYETTNVTVQSLKKMLENSNFEYSIDDDGDLYVSRNHLEIGTFIRLNMDSKLITFFTYAPIKPRVSEPDMYKFVNAVNLNILRPQFYAIGSENDGFFLYGRYAIHINYGIDQNYLILSLEKFAEAFMAGIGLDQNDEYFE